MANLLLHGSAIFFFSPTDKWSDSLGEEVGKKEGNSLG